MLIISRTAGQSIVVYHQGQRVASIEYVGRCSINGPQRVLILDGMKVATREFEHAGEYLFELGYVVFSDENPQGVDNRLYIICHFPCDYTVLRGEIPYHRVQKLVAPKKSENTSLSKNFYHVIKKFGSVRNLADRLHIKTTSIYKWHEKGGIPINRAIELKELSQGEIVLPANIITGKKEKIKQYIDGTV